MPLIFAFDLDGTLLASMKQKARGFAEVMARFGVGKATARRRFLTDLIPFQTTARDLLIEVGHRGNVDEAVKVISRDTIANWAKVSHNFRLRRGARKALEQLRRDGHFVVVSSSAHGGEIKRVLTQRGIRHLVDGVFGYSWKNPTFVKGQGHNKWIRVLAAKRGAKGKLVYVGDAPFDMQKTRRTRGAIAVGITGTVPREHLTQAGAHHVVNDLRELIPLSKRLARRRY